jgi:hypothetical protein
MLTESSDDTAEQEKDLLEMEITRLESETLEERNQRLSCVLLGNYRVITGILPDYLQSGTYLPL